MDFWGDTKNKTKTIPQSSGIFDVAKLVFKAYVNRIKTVQPNQAIFPHISSINLKGHTPGHTGYMLSIGKKKVLFTGDLFVVGAIQLPDPLASILFDESSDVAANTRLEALNNAADNQLLLATSHWPFPAMGWVKKNKVGFKFVPFQWPYEY